MGTPNNISESKLAPMQEKQQHQCEESNNTNVKRVATPHNNNNNINVKKTITIM
jgi:hypothetical protein